MTDTAAPDADITASDIAWDLSTLLSGASASTPAELVDRAVVRDDDQIIERRRVTVNTANAPAASTNTAHGTGV